MILLSHPTGNEFVRNATVALSESGLLSGFSTCISWNDKAWINKLLPGGLQKQLSRRSFPEAVRKLTKTYPWKELVRLLSGLCSIDSVYRSLDKRVSKSLEHVSGLKAVYAYEDGAFHTFKRAHELGLKRIYELPIGYWRSAQAIFEEERDLEPEWAGTLVGNFDSEKKLLRKDKELELADIIIVPSTFVKETLRMKQDLNAPIEVIPFGAPAISDKSNKKFHKGKLRVLYVGALSQRKGLSYLLKAVSPFKNEIELTIIGNKPLRKCNPLENALKRYRWIPSVPHTVVLEEMQRHDVLVLPSLFEGFALVILEAMSQRLPVIITPNTGAANMINDGEEGFIVPIRSSQAIAEKLELLIHNRDLVVTMAESAQRRAGMCTWESYRHNIVKVVRGLLK